MFVLYNIFHCSYWFSSSCNYIFGGVISFILNKVFTFKNNEKSFKQIALFILNLVFCYLIAYILAKILIFKLFETSTEGLKTNIAMVGGMILYTGLNYLGQRFLVFGGEK
ncbi:GtrA family protein [Treponema sp.]|uniref:GtrA family protein n=1 Tax=Treponema sp. TaxID=166 RepID=UPI0039A1CF7F|nr:GtrA family protein [Treponema sp.]